MELFGFCCHPRKNQFFRNGISRWENEEEDELGYNFPNLELNADKTARYQISDDWGYRGTWLFNESSNTIHFMGSPSGDNVDKESQKSVELYDFNFDGSKLKMNDGIVLKCTSVMN